MWSLDDDLDRPTCNLFSTGNDMISTGYAPLHDIALLDIGTTWLKQYIYLLDALLEANLLTDQETGYSYVKHQLRV